MDFIIQALAVFIMVMSAYLIFAKEKLNTPPCIRGWIPWFGAAFEFGKAPLDFISQARDKVSDVTFWVGEDHKPKNVCEYDTR